MTNDKRPAGEAGRSVVDLLAGKGHRSGNDAPAQAAPSPWAFARDLESQSRQVSRDALRLRGADRFHGLALASVYATAARDAALLAGGAQ